jgi:DNA polymerase III epsilon subunit-like protein
MPSPRQSPARKKRKITKPHKCVGCGEVGHNRQKCPTNPGSAPSRPRRPATIRVAHQNDVEGGPPHPLFMPSVVQDVSSVNWEKVLYLIFDLETTDRSQQLAAIIEIAAQVLDPFGIQLEDGLFSHL